MHVPRLRNDRLPRNELHEGPSSRMTSYKSLKSVKYNPYPDEDKTPTDVIHKVTSKLNGMFKDLRSAVGSIFKSSPEDLKRSRNPENKTSKLPNVSNQAIMNIDFQGLSGLLNSVVNTNKPFGEPQAEVNHMEISFGEHDKNSSGNQTLFSFRPINANQSDSRIIENLDLNGSGYEDNKQEEPKMNLLRILNFCHVLYEDTKERYTKSKPYGGSLRTVLIRGLPRPAPLRSTTPLIEFKYNKVSGKYEAHSSFKKKNKRTGTEADPNLDLREHMMLSNSMLSEDGDRVERHAYKKKRVSALEKTDEPKIYVDLKKYKKKGVASAPAKKSTSYGNTLLETYETDETEEHELRKESPYKNKVFEEDKEDYWKKDTPKRSPISSPIKGGKDSVTSKTTGTDHKSPVSSPVRTPKATPEKIDTKQNEKYQNLKITTTNTNNNDQSFSNPDFCLNDSKASENSKDTENILNLPKTPTFNLNNKSSLFSNSKSEDSIEQTTEEPVAPSPAKTSSLFSGGLFANLVKETPAPVAQENKEEIAAPADSNNNMSFCNDEPQVQKEEPQKAPEQQEAKAIPDFLKAYQRNHSVSTMENNPFLSKTTSQATNFGIDSLLGGGNVSRQESVANTNNNPFLAPAKTEAPMMNFLNNNQATNNALPAVTSTLGLFNNSNNNNENNNAKQNNLFGNNFLNSPARPRLESHSNSNMNSLFNKSTENSNGYESSGSMPRGINIFQNNHFQNDEMEKESSMGFQNNLFGGNNSGSEQKSNNLFGGNMNNNFSSMNSGNSLFQNNNNNNFFANNNHNNQSSGFGGLFGGNNNNNNSMMNQNTSSNNPFTSGNTGSQSQNNMIGGSNPFLNNNSGNNNNMGQQTQSASNFLGIGANAGAAPQQQERVFRKIIMPGSGNKKERAF